jgi:mannose-6-phosphate isomerase-like protein (cupin superfamily)
MSDTDLKQPALGTDVLKQQEADMVRGDAKPTVFALKAQLLDQGRTDTMLAASEDLTIRIKVYASGGENEIHAHTGEDHTFIVLQGSAKFFGPNGEETDIAQYQGILLPKNAYYRFYATSKEPLVMIRVGSPNVRKQKKPYRIDIDGKEMRGDSKENKKVPAVFREGAFFGVPK